MSDAPARLTKLIGRDRLLARLRELVTTPAVRQVTLCGAGGIGKTRLALELAELVKPDFEHGTRFVELAPLTDPGLVATAIAQSLNIPTPEDGNVEAAIWRHLEHQNLLLVLDNLEHLLSAVGLVPRLLAHCSDLVIVATSRERLDTPGERVVEVEPLGLPDRGLRSTIDSFSASPAVQLFIDRAKSSAGEFELTDTNAAEVSAICRRLDGLPLAIELAAARVAELPPKAILARFERLLPFLQRSGEVVELRHQTMRNAVAWSYELLDREEQTLFRALSVFAGGFTIEAAHAMRSQMAKVEEEQRAMDMAPDAEAETVTILASLVKKHLLESQNWLDDEPRYVMLETIREFGLELLDRSDESDSARSTHASYFFGLADRVRPKLRGPDPGPWLSRLDRDLDNVRAALNWLLRHEGPVGVTAVGMCNRVAQYWLWRGLLVEAKSWLTLAVENAPDPGQLERATAFLQLGHLENSDLSKTKRYYEESLTIFRTLDHKQGIAGLLTCLALNAEQSGSYAEATAYLEESLAIFRSLSDQRGLAQSSYQLGTLASKAGSYEKAKMLLANARDLWEQEEDVASMAFAIAELGHISRRQERLEEAFDLLEWSLARLTGAGIEHGQGLLRYELAMVALSAGDLKRASSEFRAAIRLLGSSKTLNLYFAGAIEGLAEIAVRSGQYADAAILYSAVDRWQAASNYRRSPAEVLARTRSLGEIRRHLGAGAYQASWSRGQVMSITEAADAAVLDVAEKEIDPAPARRRRIQSNDRLTSRERQVLCLITQGLSNQQIADALTIEPRTVTTHIVNIFGKLEVENRTHAAAVAYHHNLCSE